MLKSILNQGILGLGFVIAIALTGGCGGDADGGGGSCKMVGGCGGNIVGDWKVTASCMKLSGPLGDADCPAATLKADIKITGTASFTTGMTYTMSFSGSGNETIFFPSSCLTRNGVTVTCDQLNQVFQATPLGPPVTSVHCTPAGGGSCNCLAMISGLFSPETGTYSTAGSTLSTTATGGTPGSTAYCAKGNTLDLTDNMPSTDMFEESANITLTRM